MTGVEIRMGPWTVRKILTIEANCLNQAHRQSDIACDAHRRQRVVRMNGPIVIDPFRHV